MTVQFENAYRLMVFVNIVYHRLAADYTVYEWSPMAGCNQAGTNRQTMPSHCRSLPEINLFVCERTEWYRGLFKP